MKVRFLGVGEACDERFANTSIEVEAMVDGQLRSLILDCGFTVPWQYFRPAVGQEDLDGIWISHFHGDHFLGIPALLLRLWEMERKKPMAIIGPAGVADLVGKVMSLAYPNLSNKLRYPLQFHEIQDPAGRHQFLGLSWRFAETRHSQRNLSLCLEDAQSRLFYSGDGIPTAATQALAEGCDLIIHESFQLDRTVPGHGSVRDSIELARAARAGALAMVHLQRDFRRDEYRQVLDLIGQFPEMEICLPEPGHEVWLGPGR